MSPLPLYVSTFKKDRMMGLAISFFFHSFLFIGGGLLLAQPVQYAVETGAGGVEVSLTAAPAEPVPTAEEITKKQAEAVQENFTAKDPDDMSLPQDHIEKERVLQKTEEKKVQTAENSPYKGDGSSTVPGKDQTTFYSRGGAITEAKPNYLRNPAPPYPFEARKKGWEGLVILRVSVNAAGHASKVELEKSSGYAVLDETAMKTVRSWSFQPAQLGGLSVESSARVPVRFQLKNNS